MGKINTGRLILGGIVAGILVNISETCLNAVVLKDQWAAAMKALGKPMTAMTKTVMTEVTLPLDQRDFVLTRVFAAPDGGIDGGSLRQHVLRPVVDDGVDFGVDRVQPRQRRGRRLLRRDFLRPDQRSDFRSRQAP